MDIYYLLKAICESIAKEFPNQNIYINDITQGFKRPSFYVSLITFDNEDLVKGEFLKRATFEVVYFSPIDDRGQVDKLAQTVAHMKITDIFSTQAITVATKENEDATRVKIIGMNGGPRDSEVYLTLDFEYASIQDVDTFNPEEVYELMREIQIKYTIK